MNIVSLSTRVGQLRSRRWPVLSAGAHNDLVLFCGVNKLLLVPKMEVRPPVLVLCRCVKVGLAGQVFRAEQTYDADCHKVPGHFQSLRSLNAAGKDRRVLTISCQDPPANS